MFGRTSRPARLAVVRTLWVAAFLGVATLFIAGIPAAYGHYHHVCPTLHCADWRLSHAGVLSLRTIRLSLDGYAIYLIVLNLLSAGIWMALGLLMFLRGGRDPMALVSAFFLVLFTGGTYGGVIAALAETWPSWRLPVDVVEFLGQSVLIVFFLVFPDGRFMPRWAALLIVPAFLLAAAPVFSSLVPVLSPYSDTLNGLMAALYFVVLAVQIWRYRTVSTAEQRRQTRWVLFGAGLTVFGIAGIVALQIVGASALESVKQQSGILNMVVYAAWYLVMIPIPLSIVLAVTRSRLWDIDALINRTLVYGSLTVTLAALYIGGVIVLQALARAFTGQSSDLAIAIATLAVAALFNPWRRRVQSFIDQRFYRRKYDAGRILAAFNARLRDEVDLDQLTGDLLAVTHDAVQPVAVALWLREPAGAA